MFTREIPQMTLTNDVAERLFDNITAASYGMDRTFAATLRAVLHKRLPAGESLHLTLVTLNDYMLSVDMITETIRQHDHGHSYTLYIVFPRDRNCGKQLLDNVHTSIGQGRQYLGAYMLREDLRVFFIKKLDGLFYLGDHSTTPEFVLSMLSMIFPFSEIVKSEIGKMELSKALSLCFLNGGLPQGTPISPFITNVMMIPLDHRFSNSLRNFEKHRFVYTRYADDILISCKHDFDKDKVQAFVVDTLREFNAPFTIKPVKTRYGSSAGKNWNLGIMLNKDNMITIGHKKKKHFKAMLDNYIRVKKSGRSWELHDVQVLSGLISYYRMIEREYIDYVITSYSDKNQFDIITSIKTDLSA